MTKSERRSRIGESKKLALSRSRIYLALIASFSRIHLGARAVWIESSLAYSINKTRRTPGVLSMTARVFHFSKSAVRTRASSLEKPSKEEKAESKKRYVQELSEEEKLYKQDQDQKKYVRTARASADRIDGYLKHQFRRDLKSA